MEDRMTAQKLKNSILQMAVQGKLVPQDPNDEPASVLLERIRKEKEQLIKEGKIKRNKNESYIFRGADNLHYEQIGKEVRCIEDELPFEIPDSWEWIRLNEIRIKEIKRGKSPKYATEGNVLVFAQKCNTKYNGIDISLSKYLDPSSLERYDDSEKMIDGDIVINSTGTGTMGRIGYYSTIYNPNNYILVPDSHVTIVRVSTYLNSRFIKNTIDQYHDYFEKHGEGSTNQKELKPITIQNILIPIPPQSEQIKIIKTIDKLEPLIEKYRHAEELLYELNSNIKEQLKKSILQYAIEGKLVPQDPNDEPASVLLERIHEEKSKLISEGKIKKDKNESIIYRRDNSYYEKLNSKELCIDDIIPFAIPDTWRWSKLGACLDVRDGTHNTPNYVFEGVPLITSKNLSNGRIDFSTAKLISKEDSNAINLRSKVDNDDILYAMIGSIGNPVLYQGAANFSIKNVALFKSIPNGMNMEYVYQFLLLMQDDMKKSASGGVQVFVSLKYLRNYLIPIPPMNEQKRICNAIKKTFLLLTTL